MGQAQDAHGELSWLPALDFDFLGDSLSRFGGQKLVQDRVAGKFLKGPALPVFRWVQAKQVQSGRVPAHDVAMRIKHDNAFSHAVEQGFEFFLFVLELLKVSALRRKESGEPVLDGAQQVVFADRQRGEQGSARGHGKKSAERVQTLPQLCPLTQGSAQRGNATDKGCIPDPLRTCVRGKGQKEIEQEQGQQSETDRKQHGKGNIVSHTNGLRCIR